MLYMEPRWRTYAYRHVIHINAASSVPPVRRHLFRDRNRCWYIINWTTETDRSSGWQPLYSLKTLKIQRLQWIQGLQNKFQWKYNRYAKMLLKVIAFLNAICKMSAIFFRPECNDRPRKFDSPSLSRYIYLYMHNLNKMCPITRSFAVHVQNFMLILFFAWSSSNIFCTAYFVQPPTGRTVYTSAIPVAFQYVFVKYVHL